MSTATTTTFHSSTSGFSRLGSSASGSVASRSILSSSSTRGRKYRRRNAGSSIATNSTYCGSSRGTNNNSLVLVDEASNHSVIIGTYQSQPRCANTGQIVKLSQQTSPSVGVEIEGGNNNNFVPRFGTQFGTNLVPKSPKLLAENKTTLKSSLPSSESLVKFNSPVLQRKNELSSNKMDGSKILVIDKNLHIVGAADSNDNEKSNIIDQQKKQVIQMNVLGLGKPINTSDDKQKIDADEIKIDYRFSNDDDDNGEDCEHHSSLVLPSPQITNELNKDLKLIRFGPNADKISKRENNKFRRYISMDMEGEEEFYDDVLAIEDDDYEHDYDDHEEFIDDEDDDGEEVYHVGDLDEMEYLENITSCNKVENVVMLSEFEQNLLKECEDFGGSESGSAPLHGATGASPSHNRKYKTKSGKRWSMFHGQKDRKRTKNRENTNPSTPPSSSDTLIHRNKKWNQVLPGPSRAITTIEENSSS